MKKHRRSATKLLLATIVLTAGMSITSWAMTAEEVTAKNPTSYTAGSNSIYGPSLNQEQLKAVAQATADFVTNNITEGMSNDQKIRAGYDYIKNNVTYVDWDKAVGANTAYGGLVTRQAACSGMTRGFIALKEAVDVKAYWIHATGNDHQWNMVEFNDGFYFIDIDANIASGGEFIYKAATHPYAYDTAAYPAIGSHSGANTSGTSSVTEGWKQDAAGWWYQNADGSYPANAWKQVNGKWYYFEANGYIAANKWINGTYYVGSDGAMLTNTTTPDGYQVGADGAWIQGAQSQVVNDGVHIYRASQDNADAGFWVDDEGFSSYMPETRNGIYCDVIDKRVSTLRFSSKIGNIDPQNHYILIYGAKYNSDLGTWVAYGNNGVPIRYEFEYDKAYSLDFTGNNLSAESLSKYCLDNDIIINVAVIDDNVVDANPEKTGMKAYICYANSNSISK